MKVKFGVLFWGYVGEWWKGSESRPWPNPRPSGA